MKNIAIFVSGGGSNFKAIFKNIAKGNIPAKICLVVSNNPKCGAIDFANKNLLPTLIINKFRYPEAKHRESLLINKLKSLNLDLICLAGYLKKIPNSIVNYYKNKIINIHPSLLPEFGGKGFYGMKVHNAVIQSKKKITGATVHFVDGKYDNGPIIIQEKIIIDNKDDVITLAKKVLEIEHNIYVKAIKAFCEGRIFWENNKPLIGVEIEN
tara:strand:+ start:1665 stop:2297 length:633 start_codon:yes stop_codon:yes gene_type:complete